MLEPGSKRTSLVQPETLLRWHRELFRLYWKRRSKASSHKPRVAAETIALMREMAKENRLWGAERIRGELLKLGIRVCKRTIQKYMRRVRTPQPRGQRWSTFLHKHSAAIWSCDFQQVTDLFFRSLFAFFLIELKSRRVIHVGVTLSPSDPWVAQQLREATPFGQAPKYLICVNDSKFGPCFVRVATTSAIKILNTPYHAPRANAICERFLRRSHRICQALRPSYCKHTYGEKTVMPLTRKTFPLASRHCPEALPLTHDCHHSHALFHAPSYQALVVSPKGRCFQVNAP